jgi:diguanylate cyclase (GGDEF)-like protein
MRTSTQTVLESAGYTEVVTAPSAQAAFRLLGIDNPDQEPPPIDVILMDVTMPHVDGIEACRRFKSDERFRDIPVIMVTGRTEESDLATAFAAGAIDYITKPIKVIEMLARLRSALTLKHELDGRNARQQELIEVTRQLREANQSLQRLSTLDALTGVPNRRSFNNSLYREWGRAVRDTVPISLIMIDVDHFKAYNDHYGHPQGDECLRQVAKILHDQVKRPGDMLARYGGEEFVALLTHTGIEGATAVAEALRASVDRLHLEHACSAVSDHVTVSVGVASAIPDRNSTPDDLVSAADQALYEAKHQGRNRVIIHNKSLESAHH